MINLVFLLPILGAFLSRLHGSELLDNKVLKSLLFAAPLSAPPLVFFWQSNLWLGAGLFFISLVLCALGKSTGHGQWFSLAHVFKYIKPERLDFIVTWFFGPDPRTLEAFKNNPAQYLDRPISKKLYWRCVFGMSLKGVSTTAGAALTCLLINPAFSVMFFISGALMAPAYMLGWRFYKKKATVFAEFASGFAAYLPLSFIFIL